MLIAESLSRFGFQIVRFVLPLLILTDGGGSATQVGLVSGAQFLPVVLFSLPAGAYLDRVEPRTFLAACSFVRAATPGAAALLYAVDVLTFPAVLVAAFVIGTATVCYDIAFQSTIGRMVPSSAIASANGILQAVYAASSMAGPGLAGVLLQLAGAPVALTLTVVLFGAALLALHDLRRIGPSGSAHRSTAAAAKEGLRFTLSSRPIRDLCCMAGLFNLFEQAFLAAFTVFAIRTLGLTTGALGLVVAAGSVGALAGSVSAGRITAKVATGRLLMFSPPVAAAGFVLVPLSSAWSGLSIYLLTAGFLVNGCAMAVLNVCAVSLRQTIPPPHLLGSVTAAYRMIAMGTIPLGGAVGGLTADLIGLRHAVWTFSLSLLVAGGLMVFSPLRRLRSITDAAPRKGRSR